MRNHRLMRLITLSLTAVMSFSNPITSLATEGGMAVKETIDDAGVAESAGSHDTATETRESGESLDAAGSEGETLDAAGSGDVSLISDPRTTDAGDSTWDCIWFGDYSQDDTKDPIKWRVLDIDENGDALLLADKLTDLERYDQSCPANMTWEQCTLRSFLNSYGPDFNRKNIDYSSTGFLKNKFSSDEISAITTSTVVNDNNPVCSTEGGNDTSDKIFCLSIAEATNSDYGFVNNGFNGYRTDPDYNRVAATRNYSDTDPVWWLRSPGRDSYNAAYVDGYGVIDSYGVYVDDDSSFVRPAFRMNLSSSSSLWKYAGTVCSDGTVKEALSVDPSQRILHAENTVSLNVIDNCSGEAYTSSGTWASSDATVATVDESGNVTAVSEGSATITFNADSYLPASCKITVVPDRDIADPVTEVKGEETHSTWDCIWFGDYWQDDTNGDGHCFSKDTTVSKHDDGYYYTQDDIRLYYFEGNEGIYPADEKQPIKWRVLDIDENGDALLLADKLIDIECYNTEYTDVTWETCTLRSFLNNYDSLSNNCEKDYSSTGFLNNAFSSDEISAITTSTVVNDDNPVYGTEGGNNTTDRIFCLSIAEARTADYGFVKNEFTRPRNGTKYYTDNDPTRVAVTTDYTDDKEGFNGHDAGTADDWWLRSPGYISVIAAYVGSAGSVYASSIYVYGTNVPARPAFRMNLSSSSSLWKYAGTVCSDGTVNSAVAKVSLSTNALEIISDDEITLAATVFPSDAADKSVTWSSSKESVAAVDSTGKITAKSVGVADITVTTTDGGCTDTCTVTVKPRPVTGVSLSPNVLEMLVGDEKSLTANIEPSNATDQSITWNSSNKNVATVDSTGKITAKSVGTADITVTTTDGDHTDTCTVTVNPVPVTGVSLNTTTLEMWSWEEFELTATVEPDNATYKDITWDSSNKSVATVDSTGKVKAVSKGQTVISAVSVSDITKSASCNVIVKEKSEDDVKVTSVALDKTSLNLIKGNTSKLTATVKPSNATETSINWISGDTSVVTLEEEPAVGAESTCTVTATGTGTTVIKAVSVYDGSIYAECTVVVTDVTEWESVRTTAINTTSSNVANKFDESSNNVVITFESLETVQAEGSSDVTYKTEYTGKAVTPLPTVTFRGVELKKDSDYKVSYKKNKTPGTATVTVKGIGEFKGSASQTFEITKADLKNCVKEANDVILKKEGKEEKTSIKVYSQKGVLIPASNYTVKYSGNTTAGTATVTLEAKENSKLLTGSGETTFEILGSGTANNLLITKAMVKGVKALEYTGEALEQTGITVTDSKAKKDLTAGTDYELEYRNNINAGTATMIIRGIGDYSGVKYVNFKIKPCKKFGTGDDNKTAGNLKDGQTESSLEAVRSQSESSLVIKLSDDSTYTYTGYPIKPIPLVTFNDTVLTEGTDYTLSWSKNTNVTKVSDLTDEQDAKKNAAVLKIKFKGNMTFTRTVYFKIEAVDWNKITMSLDPSEINATSNKAVPVFYRASNDGTKPLYEMITLKKGKAYSARYKYDKSAGTVEVTVKGAGPYKSTKTQPFAEKKGSYTYTKP